jgi:SAM-dependent methyltransferase
VRLNGGAADLCRKRTPDTNNEVPGKPMKTIQLLKALRRRTKSSIERMAKGQIERLRRMKYPRIIPVLSGVAGPFPTLSPTQEYFCSWNAERLGISEGESRRRYIESWSMLPNGHAGQEIRTFADLSYGLYEVFIGDNETEVYEAYRIHSQMHFLRMLAYPESVWPAVHPVVSALSGKKEVTIVDYGCGLAQHSRGLAQTLRKNRTNVRVVLVDIPTLRKDFLLWMASKTGTPTEFLECSSTRPVPVLPNSDVVIATEVFEHLHDPMPAFEAIHRALEPSGFLLTNISDHEAEFMHVCPNLKALRDRTRELKYEEIQYLSLFRKPSIQGSQT